MTWLIAIFGLLLRFAVVRTQGTYWFDESFSVHFAAMPLAQAVGFLIRDVHPTLYYIVLHFWIGLFGEAEMAVRALSAVLGAFAVVAIGHLARRAFGPRAGLIAALIAAASPILLFQSAEARMYPLLILLVALGTAEFLSLMSDAKRLAWRWAVLMGLACFTHLTALTPFVVMAVTRAYMLRKDRKAFLSFLGVSLLALAPFLVWFLTAASARLAFVGREWQLNFGNDSGASLSHHFVGFFANGAAAWQKAFLFAALVFLFLRPLFNVAASGRMAWRIEATDDKGTWMMCALALSPFLAFVAVTTSVAKYFVVALPACLALVAGGLDALLPKSRRAILIAGAVWLIFLAGPISGLTFGTRFRYDEVARFIETRERPGDVVYASWFPSLLPLERYYHGTLPLYAINPYETEEPFDQSLIRHTGHVVTKEDLDVALTVLAERAKDAPHVFLVAGTTGLASTPVERWFAERGWPLVDTHRSNEWSPVVYEFLNPKK